MREWLARLRDWLRRDRLDRELTEELRFHREQLERDAGAEGAGADEAPYAARRRLGNATQVHEEARDRWSWPWLDHFQKDLRYALRGLRRSPGFTATVVLTLGLGIGANAAMFGVIDRLMFRPFPLPAGPRPGPSGLSPDHVSGPDVHRGVRLRVPPSSISRSFLQCSTATRALPARSSP